MPKIIELTVEIEIQRVSCPGVWLCQDGRVSLTVFALGTSYQTCLLPSMFPLLFKDMFYFRKRFQETCALNNICCLLKDETIFCELVQWCEDCNSGECTILAQYLGALNDVLFPPNMCSTDGVDLLMRRSKDFPGILSPKIEIATKVRIDEVWNTGGQISKLKTIPCNCTADIDAMRQRQVCHTPQYHRNKCNAGSKRPRSRSRSGGSRSCISLRQPDTNCKCPNPIASLHTRRYTDRRPRSASRARPFPTYNVYNATTADAAWCNRDNREQDDLEVDDSGEGCENSPTSSRASSPSRSNSARLSSDRRELNTDDRKLSGEVPAGSATQRGCCSVKQNRSSWLREHSASRRECYTSRREFSSPQRERKVNVKREHSVKRERQSRGRSATCGRHFEIYNVATGGLPVWTQRLCKDAKEYKYKDDIKLPSDERSSPTEERREDRYKKIQLESRYIEDTERQKTRDTFKKVLKLKPCVCEICKRYHELFHNDSEYSNY